ncbi:MAG: caspase family protein [Smithellaceae bacterium]|nr:caspase family protein [Smithellaceae bacterium]
MERKFIFIFGLFLALFLETSVFAADVPEIFVQKGHSSNVSTVDFSPDGKYLASGSSDKNIKLWDVEAGREIRTFVARDMVDFVAFSPDGQSLLSLESKGGTALWNVKTGREIRRLSKKGKPLLAIAAAFSPDGMSLAVVGGQNEKVPGGDLTFRNIQLLDLKTGRELMIFKGHTSSIHTIAFSPDGKYLASGSETPNLNKGKKDNTVRLWEVNSGKEIHRFAGHTEGVSKVAFSPDGQLVASISEDRNIFFWNVASGKLAKALSGFPAGNMKTNGTIAFSPDGRYFVAVSSFPPVMILWNMVTGQVEASLTDDHKLDDAAVRFSPDGRLIAVSATDKVSLWDAARHRKIRSFGGDVQGINLAFFSADQEQVKIAGNEELAVFDRRQGRLTGRRTIEPFDNWWTKGQNEWGNRRFFKIIDKGYQVIDSRTDRAIISDAADRYPTAYDSPQQAVTFSPDGRYALMADKDGGSIRLVDVRNRRAIALENFPDHLSLSSSSGYVAFSPDGSLIAAASYSLDDERGVLGIWNTATGKQSIRLRANQKREGFNQVAFTADSRQIVTAEGGNQGILGIWDLTSGREVRSFPGHPSFITSLALSGDGKFVVSGDWIGTVKLWNLRQGGEIKTLKGHTDEIKSLAFSGDRKHILSASKDGTTRLWNISTGKETVQFVRFKDGEWIVITPEGYYNASAGGDKHLNVRIGDNVYGIENYRESFFRPDLVKIALSGGSLQDFRTLADVKEPPSVKIVDTPSQVGTDDVTIRLQLTEKGGGVGDIRLYLNGTAVVMDSRAVKLVSKDGKAILKNYTLKLAQGRNVIRAVAFNGDNSMQSNDAVYEVTATFASAAKPSLTALVIGINEFKNPKLKLNYPVADAELFAKTLKQAAEGLFEKVHIKKLVTREATTSEAIIREIQSFKALRPDDLFVFYIASHGTVDEGEYFLITSNVGSLRTEKLKTDAISQHTLKEALANIPATKKLIIIDTCNAGALGEAIQVAMLTRGMSEDTALKILSRAVGSTILSASTSLQEALEGYQGHGLFTYVLTEGLKGKADKGRTGYIRTTELADYVDNEVPILAEKVFKRAQYPTISISGQAFPIGKVK